MFRLALITGATGGLGKALARALAKKKISLLLTATRIESLQELAKELQPLTSVDYCVADLSSPTSRGVLLELIRRRIPDLIINNAGFGLYGEALSYATEAHAQLAQVNVAALMEITLEAARALLSQPSPGTILNVSSALAFFSAPYHASYSASKAFVNNFSRAFSHEMKPYGIRILTSCPGQINTYFRARASRGRDRKKDLWDMSPDKTAEKILRQIEDGTPLRIINGFYHLMISLSRLLPSSFIEKHIARVILRRTRSY